MTSARSIRVFLADGSVTGIRHAEVVNWTGQALACPRTRVGELMSWSEATRPGVYLLFGVDEVTGGPAVYIGEAENVVERLQSHITQKDFWTEIVLFSNKDENLTKAHVRFLEAKITELAKVSKRYIVKNANQPQAAHLPRGDRAAMEDFLEQARLLLGVLGHRVLEPIVMHAVGKEHMNAPDAATGHSKSTGDSALQLTAKGLAAYAVATDEGIVVLAGSTASSTTSGSISGGYKRLREQLVQQGVLMAKDGLLIFSQDFLFSSPSAAACVVVGSSINGRDAWRTADGTTLAELEDAKVTPA